MRRILLLLWALVSVAQADTQVIGGIEWTYSIDGVAATIGAIPTSTAGAIEIPATLGGCPVTRIAAGAFADCASLTSVSFPTSVWDVGQDAFDGCAGLTEVHISDLAAWCNTWFGCGGNPCEYAHRLFLNGTEITNLSVPDGVTSIGSRRSPAVPDLFRSRYQIA